MATHIPKGNQNSFEALVSELADRHPESAGILQSLVSLVSVTTTNDANAELSRYLSEVESTTPAAQQKDFSVDWEIELCAVSPVHAAAQALEIQRDPNSFATTFHVVGDDGVRHLIEMVDAKIKTADAEGDTLSSPAP